MRWPFTSLMALSLASSFATACEQKKTKVDELIAAASEAPAVDAGKQEKAPAAGPVVNVKATPRERPPRPLARGQWGPVQMTDPLEVQQKTLAYTYAMATPDPGDPPVEKAFVEAFRKKLEQAVRAMDPEPDRVSVISTQGDRRIDVEMSAGCTERGPFNLSVQRASTPLATLAQAGVFVVGCHDAKWKCLQSTREPDDVICVVAPRR
jgi:hypothetical protein